MWMRYVSDGSDYSLVDSGISWDLRIDSTMWIRSVSDGYDYFRNIATSEWTMWIRFVFLRLRLFFIDSGISQLQIDGVNKVCFRRLWLLLLIPGSCDLRIDDVNKVSVRSDGSDFILDSRISRLQIDDVDRFCFQRLRFRPMFWEPGKPQELGHGYPVL
jgi:hypothetical protein